MDERRRIEMQILAVVLTYRSERRRLDDGQMVRFRHQAQQILAKLVDPVRAHPDLEAQLAAAIREVDEESISSE